jgi:hypothetical protein
MKGFISASSASCRGWADYGVVSVNALMIGAMLAAKNPRRASPGPR